MNDMENRFLQIARDNYNSSSKKYNKELCFGFTSENKRNFLFSRKADGLGFIETNSTTDPQHLTDGVYMKDLSLGGCTIINEPQSTIIISLNINTTIRKVVIWPSSRDSNKFSII